MAHHRQLVRWTLLSVPMMRWLRAHSVASALVLVASLALAACDEGESHAVGGTISGLTGNGELVLVDNGRDGLTLSTDGPWTFATPLASGLTYQVTISRQPVFARCGVTNGFGTVRNTDITNVLIHCRLGY
jgi:hypothetical protein